MKGLCRGKTFVARATCPCFRRAHGQVARATFALALLACSSVLRAQYANPPGVPLPAPRSDVNVAEVIKRVGIDQKLDAKLPLEAQFRDETGSVVRLGDYFGGRK